MADLKFNPGNNGIRQTFWSPGQQFTPLLQGPITNQHAGDASNVRGNSIDALNFFPASLFPSDPHASRALVGQQGHAANQILSGDPHATPNAGHGNGHATPNAGHGNGHGAAAEGGGGHHFDPLHVSAHAGHFFGNAAEAIDHTLQHGNVGWGKHGSHGTPHGNPHGTTTPTPVAEPVVTTPPAAQPTVSEPVIQRQTPRAGSDMADMIENMERNGLLPEQKPVTTAAAETPTITRRQPVGSDMTQMIDDMERTGAIGNGTKPTTTATPHTTSATPHTTGGANAVAADAATDVAHATPHGGPSALGKVVRVADRVLGPASIYFGAKETIHGIHQIQHGEKFEGTTNVVAGSATVVSGAAATVGAFGTTAVAAAAAPIALGAAGVAATADGVKTLVNGIRDGRAHDWRPEDKEKVGVGAVKTGAGVAMMAGVATGNPILVAGGAITYGAAVVYENREAIGHWVGEKSAQVGQVASNVSSAISSGVSSATTAVSNRVSGAVDSVSGAASSAWKWAFGS